MAFPRNLLNQNEELVLDLRPHWLFLFPSGATVVAIMVLWLVRLNWRTEGAVNDTVNITLGVALLVALVWAGWKYLVWNNTNFVLTSDRIVTRRGVVAKQGVEIPLERINTVFFKQSVFERIVGAGDLGIESAGERGSESFSDVRKPSIVQKEIYVQMEANENRKFDRGRGMHPAPTDATTPQGAPQTIPEQIEKLAELHQRGVLSDAEYQRKKSELLDRM